MLHVDEIGAKPPIYLKIVKTHLDQTVSDLRSDSVGHFICVQQSTFSLQEGPPVPVFGGLGARFKIVATRTPKSVMLKPIFVKPLWMVDLTRWEMLFVSKKHIPTQRNGLP